MATVDSDAFRKIEATERFLSIVLASVQNVDGLSGPDLRGKFRQILFGVIQLNSDLDGDAVVIDRLFDFWLMLSDLDRGIVNPALAPAKISGGRPDGNEYWFVRGAVAAAVEGLKRLGWRQAEIVNLIKTDFSDCDRAMSRPSDFANSISKWCDQCKSGRGNTVAIGAYKGFLEISSDEEGACAALTIAASRARLIAKGDEPDWFKEEMKQ